MEDVQQTGGEGEGGSRPCSPGSEILQGLGAQEEVDMLSDDISESGWETDLDLEEEKEEYDPSGRTTYIKTCETLGIIPTSYFVRTILNKESQINMSHHGVGPKGAKAIAISLIPNTNITQVDLSDNGLGTDGVVAVSSMMKENCYITHLNLSDNEAGPPAAYAIAQMMNNNTTLTHLMLRGNGFNDQAAEPLAEMIKTSLHMKYLDLSHNEFGELGGELLGPAIGDSETIQTLDLSWNHIRKKGALAIAEGLKTNAAIRHFNLAFNGFADKGMTALADALKVNSILRELDVSNNRITHDGVVAISKVFPSHENLSVIRLGRNPIQPSGLALLLEAVRACSTTTFQCLDLSNITITLDIEKTVKELKESHPHVAIPHGGVGGFKPPKPLLPPLAKLVKYCKENKVVLLDLFRLFDKEQRLVLSEEEFRAALKHVSSPLMEFERSKLIKEYKTDPPKPQASEGDGEVKQPSPQPQDGEELPVFIDYMQMVGVAQALESEPIQS